MKSNLYNDEIVERILIRAALKAKGDVTLDEAFEMVLKSIEDVPNQIQFFVDQIISMQKEFPMPKEGWEQFLKDLEHTNKKYDFNLKIKPELLE